VIRGVCIDHLTLPVSDLDASRLFYAAALGGLGWTEVSVENMPTWGPPGDEDFSVAPGTPHHPGYYAAYLLDPDGNNVEAVLHERGGSHEEPPAAV
jgi:catechol 2,3-dioxygenase-like lactoylglutathione lyase family enzyme